MPGVFTPLFILHAFFLTVRSDFELSDTLLPKHRVESSLRGGMILRVQSNEGVFEQPLKDSRTKPGRS